MNKPKSLHQFVASKFKGSLTIPALRYEDRLCSDDVEKCVIFADTFAKVFTKSKSTGFP